MVLTLWKPHKNQSLIRKDKHRFKVVVCGRRFGKTTLAVNILLEKALSTSRGLFWYVSPTYRQSKTIAWRMLVQAYYDLPKELQRGKNESELWIEVGNYSRIELKGADNEDSLRGSGLDGIVVDEVASIDRFRILWEEVLRPALTDKKGWGLFIGTPKGFNHFYELWIKESQDTDFKSWRFTSYDNPFLDYNEIDKAKRELTEDSFAQEYLADFRKYTGLIYKEFDRRIHIIEPIILPNHWQFYRAMDFGAVNPTVCLWIVVDNADNIYVFGEYYNIGRTQFHAGVISAKTKYSVISTFGDPSAEQEQLDYAGHGLYITPAIKLFSDGQNWVNSGIDKVKELFKVNPQTNRPRLYIFNNCVNLIKELESYRWQEQKDTLNSKEVPVKENDHGPDALRYFVVSYSQPKQEEYSPEIEYNKTTGY